MCMIIECLLPVTLIGVYCVSVISVGESGSGNGQCWFSADCRWLRCTGEVIRSDSLILPHSFVI